MATYWRLVIGGLDEIDESDSGAKLSLDYGLETVQVQDTDARIVPASMVLKLRPIPHETLHKRESAAWLLLWHWLDETIGRSTAGDEIRALYQQKREEEEGVRYWSR